MQTEYLIIPHTGDKNRRLYPTSLNHVKEGIYKPSYMVTWVDPDHERQNLSTITN